MAQRVFSRNYDAGRQKKFVEAFEAGDLGEAYEILEGLPAAQSGEEKVIRLVVLVEGYKALAKAYLEGSPDGCLKAYQRLGSSSEIERMLNELPM